MSNLDAVICDPARLNGTHLVSASAGTGKTYSIQSLYLSLILLKGLKVQEILVVTFTDAATKELRERLRNILRDALRFLESGRTEGFEDRIVELRKKLSDAECEAAKQAIRNALLDFDLAAIYTIHGFCLRALGRFAFETGQSFNAEPVSDSTAEIDRLCEDWWRRNVSRATNDEMTLMALVDLSLSDIKTLAKKYIAKPDAELRPAPAKLDNLSTQVANCLASFATDKNQPRPSPPSSELPEDGRDVWDEIRAAIMYSYSLPLASTWKEAGAALCRASKAIWKSTPWSMPFEYDELVGACIGFAEKIGSVRTFDLKNGVLVVKGVDTTSVDQALRVVLGKSADGIGKLKDRATYPLNTSNIANEIYQALLVLDTYRQGTAGDAKSVVNATKTIKKSKAKQLIGKHVVSLKEVAPAWTNAVESLRTILSRLLPGVAAEIKAEYDQSRSARDTLSFDDYLINLRSALRDGPQRKALLDALRDEYRAALIDEFQDTDPVQYAIFETIFRNDSNAPCFMVGDPKQAIYRFRNGDIETYIAATQGISREQCHELDRNFRSEENLVAAVNQLFKDKCTPEDPWTFCHEAMAYDGSLKAEGKESKDSLTVNGNPDAKPFKILFFGEEQDAIDTPGLDDPNAQKIWAQTAAQVCDLLNDSKTLIAKKPVRPRDIAVLVMTHTEADAIEKELNLRNIPVVRQGTRKVFDTFEAYELQTVLAAMAGPREARRVRAAMVTRLLGVPASDILRLNGGERLALPTGWPDEENRSDAFAAARDAQCGLENWISFFEALHKTWYKSGIAAAFNDLMRYSGMRERLASEPQGERILTNLLHLAELTHQTQVTERLSMEGLLAWVKRQLDAGARDGDEEHELRLETDDDAVRIMTVFKSKGLQFPVVFVPSLWRRQAKFEGWESRNPLEYHKKEDGKQRLIIEKGTREGEKDAIRERLQENIRLAYVALTRAIHRTVLVWGNFTTDGENSALTRLLGTQNPEQALLERFGGALAIEVKKRAWKDDAGKTRYSRAELAHVALVPPALVRVDKTHGHGSFSSLAPTAHAASTSTKDRDEAPETEPRPGEGIEKPAPIFTFPAGQKTGTCWHAIFENLPFDADDKTIEDAAEEQLELFGLIGRVEEKVRKERIKATVSMVINVLRNQLPLLGGETKPFALSAIKNLHRRSEWEFNFPSAKRKEEKVRRTSEIIEVLRKEWRDAPDRKIYLERLGSWNREIPGGYLTGFLDLLFRQNDRYYILDWKSNRRNGREDGFCPEGLRLEMAEHAYFLQYLFYSVAVHQYLQKALDSYDYDKHFGGVYYIFLRGVNVAPEHGVYRDRPSKTLIESLSDILGDFA